MTSRFPAKPPDYRQLAESASTRLRARLGALAMEEGISGGKKALLEGAALLVAFETRQMRDAEGRDSHDDALRVLRELGPSPPVEAYLSLAGCGVCPLERIGDFVSLCAELAGAAFSGAVLRTERMQLLAGSSPASFKGHFIDVSCSDAFGSAQERYEAAAIAAYLDAQDPLEQKTYSQMLQLAGIKDHSTLLAKFIDIPAEFAREPAKAIAKARLFLKLQLEVLGFGEVPPEEAASDTQPAEDDCAQEPAPETLRSIAPPATPAPFSPHPEEGVVVFSVEDSNEAASATQAIEVECAETCRPREYTPIYFSDQELIEGAQIIMDELGSSSLEDLEIVNPDVYRQIMGRNLHNDLVLCSRDSVEMEEDEKHERGSKPPRLAVPKDIEPESLRKMDLKGRSMDSLTMYKLVCLECFRLGTAKPLIGQQYAPIASLRSNMDRRLQGDPELKRQFTKAWKAMANSGAIKIKKSNGIASLQPCAEIDDGTVREAVRWAWEYHSSVHCSPRANGHARASNESGQDA